MTCCTARDRHGQRSDAHCPSVTESRALSHAIWAKTVMQCMANHIADIGQCHRAPGLPAAVHVHDCWQCQLYWASHDAAPCDDAARMHTGTSPRFASPTASQLRLFRVVRVHLLRQGLRRPRDREGAVLPLRVELLHRGGQESLPDALPKRPSAHAWHTVGLYCVRNFGGE